MDKTLNTIIDGSNSNRLFTVTGNSNVTFSGLIFTHARADYGSAIYINDENNYVNVNIYNCTLTNNYATIAGGAIAINGKYTSKDESSKFIIENSTLSNNYASQKGGAAYVERGGLSVRHTDLINNSVNSNLNAKNGFGGAIYNKFLTWSYGSNFINNTAYNGGAIYSTQGHLYTYYNKGENTIFMNNVATGSGGAIYKYNVNGTSRINNTLFFNNTAQYGGAIATIGSSNFTDVINSTFAYNTATVYGGAVYNNAISQFSASYCAFYGNNAPEGKSVYNNGGTCSADYNWWGNNTNPQKDGDINFKPSTWVIMDMTTTDNGNTVSVTANLNKYTTTGSDKKNLEYYIPFNTVTFSATTGSISPTSATLENGTYTATYYKSNENSNVSATIGSQTITETINGTGVVLNVNNVTGDVLTSTHVTGTLTDNQGNPISLGNVTLSINGVNISTVNVTNGTYSIPITLTASGEYTFYVTYNGYKNTYGVTTTAGKLNIKGLPTIIKIDDVQGSLGDTVTLNVYVVDESGYDVKNGTVKIHIYDQDTLVNVSNGVGTVQYTIIEPLGQYQMTATYLGNEVYESSTGSANLVVTKEKVVIDVPTINGETGETITATINVTNRNGTPLNGTITVKFYGQTTTLKVVNGQANYTVTLPNEEGNFNLTVTYLENGIYDNTTKTVVVGVGVTTTVLSGEFLYIVYGNPQNYTVKLTDLNGAVIVGRHIAIKLTRVSDGASKTYFSTTSSTGTAELEINLAPGSYTAECSYSGETGKFLPSTCNNNIVVQKEASNKTLTVLTADKFNETYGAGQNFTGKLLDANNRPLIGQHVALKLTRLSDGASKVYWATTDTDGAYQLQINLYAGEYTAHCSYDGTSRYEASTAYNTITVTA